MDLIIGMGKIKLSYCKTALLSFLFIILLDLVLAFAGHKYAINQLDYHIDNDLQRTTKSSVLVVFFHGPGSDSGTGFDQRTKARLHNAFLVYNGGSIDYILTLGGHWKANQNRPMAMYQNLKKVIPSEKLFSDNNSYDTLTNLDALIAKQKILKWDKIVLCSSPLHLMRIRYLLKHYTMRPFTKTFSMNCDNRYHSGWITIWREAHHEALAFLMVVFLPERIFRQIMFWQRMK